MRLVRTLSVFAGALLIPAFVAAPAAAATRVPGGATLTLSVTEVGFEQWVDWTISGCTGLGKQVKATVRWTNDTESWEMANADGFASGQTKFEAGFPFSGPVKMTVYGSCDVLGKNPRYVAKKASAPITFVLTDGKTKPKKTTPWKRTQEDWGTATLNKAKVKAGKKVTVSSYGFSPKENVVVTLAGSKNKNYGAVKANKNGFAELTVTIPKKAKPGKYTLTMTGKKKLLIVEAALKVTGKAAAKAKAPGNR